MARAMPRAPTRPSKVRIPRAVADVQESSTSYSGSSVSPPTAGQHFLHIDDFGKDELMNMLQLAQESKAKLNERDESFKPLAGRSGENFNAGWDYVCTTYVVEHG